MSASELLDQVLKLPPAERQALAEQLWQSLESEEAPCIPEPDYVQEFRRRVAAVQSGNYESMSLEESKALARNG